MLYNWVLKRYGFANGYRYSLAIFSVGMIIMYICNVNSASLTELQLTLIALFGGIMVSFALGAFFSVSYTVPTYLAKKELDEKGNDVASMYFAVLGLFEGIASGVGTGLILVFLKKNDIISWLPIIVAMCCAVAFVMTFAFKKDFAKMGMDEKYLKSNQ
jgi:hypothetical protein